MKNNTFKTQNWIWKKKQIYLFFQIKKEIQNWQREVKMISHQQNWKTSVVFLVISQKICLPKRCYVSFHKCFVLDKP